MNTTTPPDVPAPGGDDSVFPAAARDEVHRMASDYAALPGNRLREVKQNAAEILTASLDGRPSKLEDDAARAAREAAQEESVALEKEKQLNHTEPVLEVKGSRRRGLSQGVILIILIVAFFAVLSLEMSGTAQTLISKGAFNVTDLIGGGIIVTSRLLFAMILRLAFLLLPKRCRQRLILFVAAALTLVVLFYVWHLVTGGEKADRRGPLVVDAAFSRCFPDHYDTAGTARIGLNLASWLATTK